MAKIEMKTAKNGTKLYYVDGKRISKAAAMEIAANNDREIMSNLFEQATGDAEVVTTVEVKTEVNETILDNYYFNNVETAIAAAEKILATFGDRVQTIRVGSTGDWAKGKLYAYNDHGTMKLTAAGNAEIKAVNDSKETYEASIHGYNDKFVSKEFDTAIDAYNWLLTMIDKDNDLADGYRQIERFDKTSSEIVFFYNPGNGRELCKVAEIQALISPPEEEIEHFYYRTNRGNVRECKIAETNWNTEGNSTMKAIEVIPASQPTMLPQTIISITDYNTLMLWAEKISNGQRDTVKPLKTNLKALTNAAIVEEDILGYIDFNDLNGFRSYLAYFNFLVKDDAGYLHKLYTQENGDCVLAEIPTSEYPNAKGNLSDHADASKPADKLFELKDRAFTARRTFFRARESYYVNYKGEFYTADYADYAGYSTTESEQQLYVQENGELVTLLAKNETTPPEDDTPEITIGDDTVTFFFGEFHSVFSAKYHAAIVRDLTGCIHYCVYDDADTEVYNVREHEVSYDSFIETLTKRGNREKLLALRKDYSIIDRLTANNSSLWYVNGKKSSQVKVWNICQSYGLTLEEYLAENNAYINECIAASCKQIAIEEQAKFLKMKIARDAHPSDDEVWNLITDMEEDNDTDDELIDPPATLRDKFWQAKRLVWFERSIVNNAKFWYYDRFRGLDNVCMGKRISKARANEIIAPYGITTDEFVIERDKVAEEVREADIRKYNHRNRGWILRNRIEGESASLADSTNDLDDVFSLIPSVSELNDIEPFNSEPQPFNDNPCLDANDTLNPAEPSNPPVQPCNVADSIMSAMAIAYPFIKDQNVIENVTTENFINAANSDGLNLNIFMENGEHKAVSVTKGDEKLAVIKIEPKPRIENPKQLRDSLERAMKVALENRRAARRNRNLALENYEYELYTICKNALKEVA